MMEPFKRVARMGSPLPLCAALLLAGCAPKPPAPEAPAAAPKVAAADPKARPAADAVAAVRLEPRASGFTQPVHALFIGETMLVMEQGGVIRRLSLAGPGPGTIALDIRDRVRAGGEMGLLSMALHPGFPGDPRLFVNYTTGSDPLRTRVSSFRMAGDLSGPLADPEVALLEFDQPYTNHNGGLVLFGPDGMLYVGCGDGGSGNDPENNGQRMSTVLGKILRIDVDAPHGPPPDDGTTPDWAADLGGAPRGNPFWGEPARDPRIWAFGLRNPWRFAFDRSTGRLWCADVGQDRWEEVDVIEKGGNYGWRVMEGAVCNEDLDLSACTPSRYRAPVAVYGHDQGASITGGHVYRGNAIPALAGHYVFGDYVSGRIWTVYADDVDDAGQVRVQEPRLLLETQCNIASFAEDAAGELYVVDYRGAIYKIVP